MASSSATMALMLIVGLVIGIGVTYAAISSSSSSGKTTTITNTVTAAGGGSTVTVGGAGSTVTVGGSTVTAAGSTATVGGSTVTVTSSGGSSSGPKVYYIGNINDITGPLADYGASFILAAQLAINQINAQMNASGNNIQFKLATADSQGTAQGALQALQTLSQTYNVQVDVGPISSGELAGLLSYANTNHILVIGPTSNANSLSIPNDYLVRPDSVPATYEAQSIDLLAQHNGFKNLVVVWRDDTFGSGFYNATKQFAGSMNIQGISYAPGQSDYSSIVSAASSAVSSAQSSGKTGVLWIAFTTEAQNMLQHAASDSTLSGVSWFGIDDLFASNMLPPTVPTSVGQAEKASNFTVSSDYIVGNPTSSAFFTAYKQAYNKDPISYAETFYDGVWLAALDILYSGGVYNGTVLLHNIFQVADHYVGVDGQTYLDANGDQALGYFGFDQVVTNSTGGYAFSNIGYYDGSTQQIHLNATG